MPWVSAQRANAPEGIATDGVVGDASEFTDAGDGGVEVGDREVDPRMFRVLVVTVSPRSSGFGYRMKPTVHLRTRRLTA